MFQIETKGGPAPVILVERGLSDERTWKISRLVNERGQSPTLGSKSGDKWEIIHARFQTGENPRSIPPGPDNDLYIGANEPLSKFVPAGVLHRDKVFPWEMLPA